MRRNVEQRKVLAQAKASCCKKSAKMRQKELNEVQAVKERLVQQREEAEADGQIDEDEEDAHNVLVRSMLREQQEAIQAKSKADLAMLEAEQLEEAAKRSLEEAKVEQAKAQAALKKANKMARLAEEKSRRPVRPVMQHTKLCKTQKKEQRSGETEKLESN